MSMSTLFMECSTVLNLLVPSLLFMLILVSWPVYTAAPYTYSVFSS